ncbi:MAG: RNA polymerase sigma factor [Mogibacterium sp.]|nr:RNA polymerase sigma factor [Mogibacterium sp.]
MNETALPGLVRDAAAGDQKALTQLYNFTYNDVYNTAKFLVKDEDAALDIMQDTYIKAFTGLDKLSDPAKFRPWVKRIARNLALDQLRKKTPVLFSSMTEGKEEAFPEFEDESTDTLPDASLDQQETARLIREILDSLPDEQRACITLYYYEELSVKEIAAELGIPEATVKSRLQYGRRKIEAAVRDLEKKGTKLYGMAPIPFFLFLLRSYDAQAAAGVSEASFTEILQKVLSARSFSAVSAGNASMAAGKAATGAAASARAGIGIKILAGLLAVAVIGGGIGVATRHRAAQPGREQQIPASVQPSAPEEPVELAPEPETEEAVTAEAAYAELLQTYRSYYDDRANGVDVTANPDYEEIRSLEYFRFYESFDYSPSDILYYAFVDINGDGTQELILASCEHYAESDIDLWRPFEVYAFDGQKAVPLVQKTGVDIGYAYNIPNIHLMPEINGIGLDYGNGLSPKWFFTLPAGGAELEQLSYLEPDTGLPRHWVGTSGESLTDEELDAQYPNSWNYDDHGYRSIGEL